MKAVMLTLLSGVPLAAALAESNTPPALRWRKTFGGPQSEYLPCMASTSDRGFIFAGQYLLQPGSTTHSNYGSVDFWAVRTDENGNRFWDRYYGGSGVDYLRAVLQTRDGGFLLGGTSQSTNDGSKTSASLGVDDFWIVRTDANGNQLWDRSYGGSSSDDLAGIVQTSDGGFMLAGTSSSPPGHRKTAANLGGPDLWVVRIDAAGNALWDRTYGGTSFDVLRSVRATPDGGFILGGRSTSATSPTNDFWVVRIDRDGNQLWERSYGGHHHDTLTDIQVTADGGFILGGWTLSGISGNKTTPMRAYPFYYDYWAVRLDANGNKLWDQTVGGDGSDLLNSVVETRDGGFLLGGGSASHISGNKTSPNGAGVSGGYSDYWVVRLDHDGNKLWDEAYGTNIHEELYAIQPTPDGGFILAGECYSSDGNGDYCVLKLGGLGDDFRLRALSPLNVASEGFRFRAAAENDYAYRTDFSTDLVNWTPLRTNAHFTGPLEILDLGARTEPHGFYRMVQLLDHRRPGATIWRRLSVTGVAKSARLYVVLRTPGDVFLEDIQLVPGNVPETGENVVRNGDFESDLSGPWNVPAQYARTTASTEYHRSGGRSLHLVWSGGTVTRDTIVTQDLLPVALNTTHTLSFWYLPTANPTTFELRLEDNSISLNTNLVYRPAP